MDKVIMYCDMQEYWRNQKIKCYPENYAVDPGSGWEGKYCVLPHIYISQLKFRIYSKVEQGHIVYVRPGCPEWWEIKAWQW